MPTPRAERAASQKNAVGVEDGADEIVHPPRYSQRLRPHCPNLQCPRCPPYLQCPQCPQCPPYPRYPRTQQHHRRRRPHQPSHRQAVRSKRSR
jgi:hypothetical protein